MTALKKAITTVWVIQPKLKSDLRFNNAVDLINEAAALTKALPGTDLIGSTIVKIEKHRPREFFGKGKVDEFASLLKLNNIQLVVINSEISPVQQQNLEKKWKVKIVDRAALILEIFLIGSYKRCLQVEMAALTYQRSRLVRAWTHLDDSVVVLVL